MVKNRSALVLGLIGLLLVFGSAGVFVTTGFSAFLEDFVTLDNFEDGVLNTDLMQDIQIDGDTEGFVPLQGFKPEQGDFIALSGSGLQDEGLDSWVREAGGLLQLSQAEVFSGSRTTKVVWKRDFRGQDVIVRVRDATGGSVSLGENGGEQCSASLGGGSGILEMETSRLNPDIAIVTFNGLPVGGCDPVTWQADQQVQVSLEVASRGELGGRTQVEVAEILYKVPFENCALGEDTYIGEEVYAGATEVEFDTLRFSGQFVGFCGDTLPVKIVRADEGVDVSGEPYVELVDDDLEPVVIKENEVMTFYYRFTNRDENGERIFANRCDFANGEVINTETGECKSTGGVVQICGAGCIVDEERNLIITEPQSVSDRDECLADGGQVSVAPDGTITCEIFFPVDGHCAVGSVREGETGLVCDEAESRTCKEGYKKVLVGTAPDGRDEFKCVLQTSMTVARVLNAVETPVDAVQGATGTDEQSNTTTLIALLTMLVGVVAIIVAVFWWRRTK